MPIVESRKEAAEILGVDPRSLGNWKNDFGFPHRDDGHYDTEKIQAWREETKRQREHVGHQANSVKLALAAEKLRIARIDRESKEMDLELKRGLLLPRESVLECLAAWANGMRDLAANLQRAGDVNAARQVADKINLIKKQVHESLQKAIDSLAE